MTYTLLEASRELGVTKNAIKYQVKKLPPEMVERDGSGRILITADGLNEMRQSMTRQKTTQKPDKTTEEPDKNHEKTTQKAVEDFSFTGKEPDKNPLYSALLQTVETLREQLAEKDRQLAAATDEKARLLQLLDQQQQLTAGQLVALPIKENQTAEPSDQAEPTARKGFFARFKRGK